MTKADGSDGEEDHTPPTTLKQKIMQRIEEAVLFFEHITHKHPLD